jgi:hypothetical protein
MMMPGTDSQNARRILSSALLRNKSLIRWVFFLHSNIIKSDILPRLGVAANFALLLEEAIREFIESESHRPHSATQSNLVLFILLLLAFTWYTPRN